MYCIFLINAHRDLQCYAHIICHHVLQCTSENSSSATKVNISTPSYCGPKYKYSVKVIDPSKLKSDNDVAELNNQEKFESVDEMKQLELYQSLLLHKLVMLGTFCRDMERGVKSVNWRMMTPGFEWNVCFV